MREIKFRGKCIPEFPHPVAKWVYGSFVSDKLILSPYKERNENRHFWYMVDPDTVGQFTGLLDSEGKEIYEGDVVDCQWVLPKETQNKRGIVKYMSGCFMVDPEQIVVMPRPLFSITGNMLFVTIIGNIHDNPALMEVEHD